MAQEVIVGTQQFFLDNVVITLEKKGYNALLGRGWLIKKKDSHNWKKNTLFIERNGKKYVIDLRSQIVSQELSLDSGSKYGE